MRAAAIAQLDTAEMAESTDGTSKRHRTQWPRTGALSRDERILVRQSRRRDSVYQLPSALLSVANK
jgi:hypothetical protein